MKPLAMNRDQLASIRDAFERKRPRTQPVSADERERFLAALPKLLNKANFCRKSVGEFRLHQRKFFDNAPQARRQFQRAARALEAAMQQICMAETTTGLDLSLMKSHVQAVAHDLVPLARLRPIMGPGSGRPRDIARDLTLQIFAAYFRQRRLPLSTSPDGLYASVMSVVLGAEEIRHSYLSDAIRATRPASPRSG